MIEPAWCQTMAEYNRWMNGKLYAACADIPDAERKADRKAFFKSIHSTLNHILWGDRVWFGRFIERDFGLPGVGVDLYTDFGELRRERQTTDDEIVAWASGLDSSWLAEQLTWTSKLNRITRSMPRWVLVTQFFNHQTHHRGQVSTLIAQLGHDLGPTDLPWLPALNPTQNSG